MITQPGAVTRAVISFTGHCKRTGRVAVFTRVKLIYISLILDPHRADGQPGRSTTGQRGLCEETKQNPGSSSICRKSKPSKRNYNNKYAISHHGALSYGVYDHYNNNYVTVEGVVIALYIRIGYMYVPTEATLSVGLRYWQRVGFWSGSYLLCG